MARVTIEDCVDKVESRFELVLTAAQRVRKISSGASLTVDRDNDKNPVVALREIAEETILVEDLKEDLIRNNQRIIFSQDDEEEEVTDLMDGEEEWNTLNSSRQSGAENSEQGKEAELSGLEDLAGVLGENEDV